MVERLWSDYQKIANELSELYSAGPTHKGSKILRPVLKLERDVILGLPIDTSRFFTFGTYPHNKVTLSVDASLKVIFDCGAFKVLSAKVSRAVWRGRRRCGFFEPIKRAEIIWSRADAVEFLVEAEVDAALSFIEHLRDGDLCVLDRPLMLYPRYSERIKQKLMDFSRRMGENNVALVGVSKSSRLKLNTGEPLIGYLSYLSERLGVEAPWSYMPVFDGRPEGWCLGEVTVTKFSKDSKYAFRVDVLAEDELEVLSMLSYLQDEATPGYPYPIRLAHEEAKMSEQELISDRSLLLEALASAGVIDRFLASVKSMSFKEEFLWRKAYQ